MVRYARQTSNSNCGPFALLNAIKWAGDRATIRRDIGVLSTLCLCLRHGEGYDLGDGEIIDTGPGTEVSQFWRAGKAVEKLYGSLRFSAVRKPQSLRRVDRILDGGGAVIVMYRVAGSQYHFALITGRRKSLYDVVNIRLDRPCSSIKRTTLSKWLRLGKSEAWAVHRTKKRCADGKKGLHFFTKCVIMG